MDILKILKASGEDLLPEDLDLFETELATGDGYDDNYVLECRQLMQNLRQWLTRGNDGEKDSRPDNGGTGKRKRKNKTPSGLVLGISEIAPGGANPMASTMTEEQLILSDIEAMRDDSAYKSTFKAFVKRKTEIDAAFLEAHYSFFRPWERDAIVSVRQMGEEFLEKYFGALDHDKIARYQLFSEAFFMKHFSQLNPEIVLKYGKNDWRKKENRSKQLDVFLRLKGVKI